MADKGTKLTNRFKVDDGRPSKKSVSRNTPDCPSLIDASMQLRFDGSPSSHVRCGHELCGRCCASEPVGQVGAVSNAPSGIGQSGGSRLRISCWGYRIPHRGSVIAALGCSTMNPDPDCDVRQQPCAFAHYLSDRGWPWRMPTLRGDSPR